MSRHKPTTATWRPVVVHLNRRAHQVASGRFPALDLIDDVQQRVKHPYVVVFRARHPEAAIR